MWRGVEAAAVLLAFVLWGCLATGCDRSPAPRPKPQHAAPEGSSYVLTVDAEYYTSGPQQGRPPDGTWKAGTRVILLQKSDGYSLVADREGTQAYVNTESLERAQAEMNDDVAQLAVANNQFACELLDAVRGESAENLFLAPLSVTMVMQMAAVGARGETADQMAEALRSPWRNARQGAAMADLQRRLFGAENGGGVTLRAANRIFVARHYPLSPDFVETLERNYASQPEEVDFERHAEEARAQINTWVADQTSGRIEDLIPQGVLDALTRLVLVNAVYFKGDWAEPFDKERTQDGPFHVTADEQVDAPMMRDQRRVRYAKVADMQIVELPYEGDKLSMVILLPEATDGLAELEERLTGQALAGWLDELAEREARLTLPRFRMTSEKTLNDALKSLGMALAFSPDHADFAGISSEPGLYISAVLHKTFLDVNEEGTEAAAATGAVIGVTSAPVEEEIPEFRADHPFVVLIRDRATGSILMLGHVVDPTK